MIAVRQDKRQGNIYFESERHITINVSSIALLNQLNQLNLGLDLVVTVMTLTCQCGNGTTQTDQCGSSRHGPANMKLVHNAQTLSSKYTFVVQIGLSIKVKNFISWSILTVERRKTDYFSSLFSYSNEMNIGFEGKKFII